MHRIGVVGLCWRHGRGSLLSELTIPRASRVERLPAFSSRRAFRSWSISRRAAGSRSSSPPTAACSFDACRRRIFEALSGREPHPGEAEHAMRAWHGEGAAEHLFVVASGLDSARVGESEIAGQLRDALADAQAAGTVGPRLERVFTEALRVAKRVKPMTEGQIGTVSLAEIAERHAAERVLAHGRRGRGGRRLADDRAVRARARRARRARAGREPDAEPRGGTRAGNSAARRAISMPSAPRPTPSRRSCSPPAPAIRCSAARISNGSPRGRRPANRRW